MGLYVCYSELNLFGKVLLKNPTLLYVECGAKTFNENNKLLVRREEGGGQVTGGEAGERQGGQ